MKNIIKKRKGCGDLDIRGIDDNGNKIGIVIQYTPYRRIGYWVNGRSVLPMGAKSPTAKYLPQFKELIAYENV